VQQEALRGRDFVSHFAVKMFTKDGVFSCSSKKGLQLGAGRDDLVTVLPMMFSQGY
jgi:hypothetical protein